MPDRAPAYVSARSSNEILSSIRPTRIKTESLRSLNIFLDELLWLVLHSARSLATNRLKAGLLQIMPSTVGKDAILEAEVELRAYRMRSPNAVIEEHGTKQPDFPLQPTFELLRQKCEAYCTLGDIEENVSAEKALQENMMNAGPGAPSVEQVAPAALYLTAILEHICEHVLNNVGQVVARDSSRGTAYSIDVYTALCEDTAIYPLFKTMKVHEQIEAQSRAFRPSHRGSSSISGGSRTKSISRVRPSEDINAARKMSLPTTPTAMPTSMPPSTSPTTAPPSSFSRRPSADAVLATSHTVTRSASGPTLSGSSKSSLERTRSSLERITGKKSMDGSNSGKDKPSRGIKLFGKSRMSSEDSPSSHMAPFPAMTQSGLDERSASSLSDGRAVGFQQGPSADSDPGEDSDGPFAQDFDELMRSGATMKVSLTPDRLKTFEVFAKQRNQKTRGHPQEGPSSVAPPLPSSYSDPSNMVLSPRTPTARREVDAILEADETQTRSRTQSFAPFLSEDPNKAPAAPAPVAPSSVGRSRSHTESSSNRPSISGKAPSGPALLRKASLSASRDRSSPDSTPSESSRTRTISEAPKMSMPGPPVRKRGVARRRESMDLDDIINDTAPRRGGGGANASLTPKPAHQTANTRDLIDFLSEGPPEPPQHVPRSASSGAIEPGPAAKPKQSGGRWFRRLVGGSSSERVPAVPVPDVPEPTSARVLGKQKSAQNIRGNSAGGNSYGRIPPSPALSLDTALQPHSVNLTRKVSPNRKAVPTWNPDDGSAQSPDAGLGSAQPLLSPQRDVFGGSARSTQSQEPAPTLSPASSRPSLRRVPVPRLHAEDDTSSRTEAPEQALQFVPESVPAPKAPELSITPKAPEPKPERRRPERIQEPRLATTKALEDKSAEPTRPSSPCAPASGITPGQAAELRAAIAHATSADECRMLLDLVLGQWGLGRQDPEPSAVPPLSAGCSDFEDADEAMAVDMLLGEGTLRTERQWPLTPKDSHPRLHEARVASSLRSAE